MDGTISGIKANGTNADFNNEALRTIKSIKGKWIPAKTKRRIRKKLFQISDLHEV
jgi:protein TonB